MQSTFERNIQNWYIIIYMLKWNNINEYYYGNPLIYYGL